MAATNALADLKAEIQRHLDTLSGRVTEEFLPRTFDGRIIPFHKLVHVTFDFPKGDGTPFIEDSDGLLSFVVSERGSEYERVTMSPENVLYRLFEGITFSLASTFSAQKRVHAKDARRVLFAKQLELLSCLNEQWAEKTRQKQQQTLQKHPFIDG